MKAMPDHTSGDPAAVVPTKIRTLEPKPNNVLIRILTAIRRSGDRPVRASMVLPAPAPLSRAVLTAKSGPLAAAGAY